MVNDEIENGTNFKLIVELAEKNRLPAIYAFKFYVQAGGLMSYGIDFPASQHLIAAFRDTARPVNLAGCASAGRQSRMASTLRDLLKRAGSSIVARKQRAVTGPTPGAVMNRRT